MSEALKRAEKLYKSGQRVFDEKRLKKKEKWVMKELKRMGLSKKDVEELWKR